MLEVTYITALKDMVASTLLIRQRSPEFKRQFVIGWVVLPALLLVAAALAFLFIHWLCVAPLVVVAT